MKAVYFLFLKTSFYLAQVFLAIGFFQSTAVASLQPTGKLLSYKAHYQLSLGSVGPESIVSDVEGTMVVEFQDACEGWIVQQNADLLVSTQEGTDQEIKWNYVTWESKNGLLFRFNMRRYLDGLMEDNIRGVAMIDPKANEGKIIYENPYYLTQKLSPKTLFPTAHFVHLLKAARAGEKLLSCIVFDGSSLEGSAEVNAFIGLLHPAVKQEASALKMGELKKFWPIRFAIYTSYNTGEGPDLESAQQVMENGIPLGCTIDYGDFKVKGVLERYEVLKEDC